MLVSTGEQKSGGVMEQVGDNIIHHVSNSDIHHPIFSLPHLFNIDMSVTKHVLMLWIVALTVGLVVILPIQRYIQQVLSIIEYYRETDKSRQEDDEPTDTSPEEK